MEGVFRLNVVALDPARRSICVQQAGGLGGRSCLGPGRRAGAEGPRGRWPSSSNAGRRRSGSIHVLLRLRELRDRRGRCRSRRVSSLGRSSFSTTDRRSPAVPEHLALMQQGGVERLALEGAPRVARRPLVPGRRTGNCRNSRDRQRLSNTNGARVEAAARGRCEPLPSSFVGRVTTDEVRGPVRRPRTCGNSPRPSRTGRGATQSNRVHGKTALADL